MLRTCYNDFIGENKEQHIADCEAYAEQLKVRFSPENMYEKFINFGHHDEFKLSGLTINKIRDKINNREMFYDHFADKSSTNKWKSNHKLKTVDLNNLPKYLLDNKEKYKDWFDLRD